jgi:hypothetical protein
MSSYRLHRHVITDKSGGHISTEVFLDIHNAWKLLSTPETRSQVDRTIQIGKLIPNAELVRKSELEIDSDGYLYKLCRCGDVFEVNFKFFFCGVIIMI